MHTKRLLRIGVHANILPGSIAQRTQHVNEAASHAGELPGDIFTESSEHVHQRRRRPLIPTPLLG